MNRNTSPCVNMHHHASPRLTMQHESSAYVIMHHVRLAEGAQDESCDLGSRALSLQSLLLPEINHAPAPRAPWLRMRQRPWAACLLNPEIALFTVSVCPPPVACHRSFADLAPDMISSVSLQPLSVVSSSCHPGPLEQPRPDCHSSPAWGRQQGCLRLRRWTRRPRRSQTATTFSLDVFGRIRRDHGRPR